MGINLHTSENGKISLETISSREVFMIIKNSPITGASFEKFIGENNFLGNSEMEYKELLSEYLQKNNIGLNEIYKIIVLRNTISDSTNKIALLDKTLERFYNIFRGNKKHIEEYKNMSYGEKMYLLYTLYKDNMQELDNSLKEELSNFIEKIKSLDDTYKNLNTTYNNYIGYVSQHKNVTNFSSKDKKIYTDFLEYFQLTNSEIIHIGIQNFGLYFSKNENYKEFLKKYDLSEEQLKEILFKIAIKINFEYNQIELDQQQNKVFGKNKSAFYKEYQYLAQITKGFSISHTEKIHGTLFSGEEEVFKETVKSGSDFFSKNSFFFSSENTGNIPLEGGLEEILRYQFPNIPEKIFPSFGKGLLKSNHMLEKLYFSDINNKVKKENTGIYEGIEYVGKGIEALGELSYPFIRVFAGGMENAGVWGLKKSTSLLLSGLNKLESGIQKTEEIGSIRKKGFLGRLLTSPLKLTKLITRPLSWGVKGIKGALNFGATLSDNIYNDITKGIQNISDNKVNGLFDIFALGYKSVFDLVGGTTQMIGSEAKNNKKNKVTFLQSLFKLKNLEGVFTGIQSIEMLNLITKNYPQFFKEDSFFSYDDYEEKIEDYDENNAYLNISEKDNYDDENNNSKKEKKKILDMGGEISPELAYVALNGNFKIHEIAQQIPPMHPECKLSINLPAYREGKNIYKTLFEYTQKQKHKNGTPINPDTFEINILVNTPNKNTPLDNYTLNEIKRFKFKYPHFRINLLRHQFDFEGKPKMGEIYKTLADMSMYRFVTSNNRNKHIILRNGGADAMDKNPFFLSHLMEQFENDEIGVYKSESRYPKEVLETLPLLHLLYSLNSGLNRLYIKGKSNIGAGSYRSDMYAMSGGFNEQLTIGEDIDIAKKIRYTVAKYNKKIKKDLVKNAIDNPRRAIAAILEGRSIHNQYANYNSQKGQTLIGEVEKMTLDEIATHQNFHFTKANCELHLSQLYRYYLTKIQRNSSTIQQMKHDHYSEDEILEKVYEICNKFFKKIFTLYGFPKESYSLEKRTSPKYKKSDAQIIIHDFGVFEEKMKNRTFPGHQNFE